MDEARTAIRAALIHKVSGISMTPEDELRPEKPLEAYGLDSLVAVEIRNWISGELEAEVPLLELTGSSSLNALVGVIAGNSKLVARLRAGDGAS